jgi:GTP-binding protein YchF
MLISIGITGLANVGKSTLFKALTKIPIPISNYPFTTIEPNTGIVQVPDFRLEKIAKVCNSKEIIPTTIKFVDIAGLVKGAHKGEGLGNQFLAHIREVDVILHIVRCFIDETVIHVEKTVDPIRDIDIVNTELMLKDLETILKRKEKVLKDAKRGEKEAKFELEVLKDLEENLSRGKMAIHYLEKADEKKKEIIRDLFLLSAKPQIYLLNDSENLISEELKKKMEELKAPYLALDLKDELDISELTEKEIEELGFKSKLKDLIEKCYKILDVITFFTIKGDKTQAWTIKKGTKIITAAGKIHTDFEKKFIKAEVINWEKLVEVGGWKKCHELGLLRTEGRDYIVKEGDVIEIRHS